MQAEKPVNNEELLPFRTIPSPPNYTHQGPSYKSRPRYNSSQQIEDANEGEIRSDLADFLHSYPALIKIMTLALGLVAAVYGCATVYDAALRTKWNRLREDACHNIFSGCNSEWRSLETAFVILSISCVLFGLINIFYSYMHNFPYNLYTRFMDSLCQAFLGCMSLSAGLCLLSALEILKNWDEHANSEYFINQDSFRTRMTFTRNIAAASLTLVNGAFYLVNTVVILVEHQIPPRFQINRRIWM